jgi:hypothetical protein
VGLISLRKLIFFFVLFITFHSIASAMTFIFKTGKRVQGTLLYEDASTIRIRASDGLLMSLNKNSLDQAAMHAVNVEEQRKQNTLEQVERAVAGAGNESLATNTQNDADRKKEKIHVITNSEVHREVRRVASLEQRKLRAQKAKAEYVRLKNQCRAAGASPPGKGILRTDEYTVHGKRVKVTGYWADPKEIERAKMVCAKARVAEAEWIDAERDLSASTQ